MSEIRDTNDVTVAKIAVAWAIAKRNNPSNAYSSSTHRDLKKAFVETYEEISTAIEEAEDQS